MVLNWHLHRGHVIIPKTNTKSRLPQNLNAYNFTLTAEEYDQITKLDKNARFYDPKWIEGFGWNNIPYFE